jgi:hypothetical protein
LAILSDLSTLQHLASNILAPLFAHLFDTLIWSAYNPVRMSNYSSWFNQIALKIAVIFVSIVAAFVIIALIWDFLAEHMWLFWLIVSVIGLGIVYFLLRAPINAWVRGIITRAPESDGEDDVIEPQDNGNQDQQRKP